MPIYQSNQETLWDIQISHMSLHDKCHSREDEDFTSLGIQKGFKRLSQTLDSFSTLLNCPCSSRFSSGKACVKLAASSSRKNPSTDIYEDKSNICGCSKKEFNYNTSLFVFEILFHWKEWFLHTRQHGHVQWIYSERFSVIFIIYIFVTKAKLLFVLILQNKDIHGTRIDSTQDIQMNFSSGNQLRN